MYGVVAALNKATQFQNLTNFNMKNELSKTEQPCTIHGVGRSVSKSKSKSKYWKDCPKCGLKMTYGQLVTEEGYCWNCNHRGVF